MIVIVAMTSFNCPDAKRQYRCFLCAHKRIHSCTAPISLVVQLVEQWTSNLKVMGLIPHEPWLNLLSLETATIF